MKCPACGKAIQAPEHFCPGCGVQLPATGWTAPDRTAVKVSGSYGTIREQVFEVIVRQALAGAPWREICAGPMAVNKITPEEIEQEMRRRIAGNAFPDPQQNGRQASKPQPKKFEWEPDLVERKDVSEAVKLPAQQLQEIRLSLEEMINSDDSIDSVKARLAKILKDIVALGVALAHLEAELRSITSQLSSGKLIERELNRTTKPLSPPGDPGRHHIEG